MSRLTAWITEGGCEHLQRGDGPVRAMPYKIEDTGFTVQMMAAVDVETLKREAREAERERCAALCDALAQNTTAPQRRCCAEDLARQIRQPATQSAYSCAKRAVEPADVAATCQQWCGDPETCPSALGPNSVFDNPCKVCDVPKT